ncbi:AAA domain-containing protein [Erythrobacter citreus]|uniref:AAA domain-containing protein n=1 Tax=Qipengyuania citrea TaxID=225971 RepID=A0A6I4UFB3_9SPHN|nr:AAA family ATPase [Qipengyuania citrea]MDQ0564976.1 hypothetical protein [Qipengyuania citrea]MXP36009.1 AAA domain-containing protein [Qipengyuania citrea]
MPTAVNQIEPDGEIVIDFDPEQVPFEDQEKIIRDGLNARGWTVVFQQEDKQTKRRQFEMSKGSKSLTVITYIFSNLSWSSGERAQDEKRIQLSRPYDEHAQDFMRDKASDPRCSLMGIYRRNGLLVMCAWDPAAYEGHAKPTSCYVRTAGMASAARTGFGQSVDSKKRLVCCFTPDMLAYYLENMASLHDEIVITDELILPAPEIEGEVYTDLGDVPSNPLPEDLARNRIFYGAPGTGKSHNLNEELNLFFPDDLLFQRTTFYPEYTSGTFMGSFRPTPIYRTADGDFVEADKTSSAGNFEPLIDYRFVPGPFLQLLSRALSDPDHNYCLVIEEINRANASAVFADAFQMLDRDDDGRGKYSVTLSPEASDYLASKGHHGPVSIPANMFIWATMNSADQGVMPMDSAFKRRWTMEYVGLDDGEDVAAEWELTVNFLEGPVKWNAFRKAINGHLAKEGITEDRLLGPFFMTKKDLARPKAFENKLLQYLRDDVVKSAPRKLFSGGSTTFGTLVKSYRDGENIFVEAIDFGEG